MEGETTSAIAKRLEKAFPEEFSGGTGKWEEKSTTEGTEAQGAGEEELSRAEAQGRGEAGKKKIGKGDGGIEGGDVGEGTDKESLSVGARLRALHGRALAEPEFKGWEDIGKSSEAAASRIEAETGVDVRGYEHSVNADALRHAEKGHGEEGESDAGQEPVTAEDVARVPEIVGSFDRVERGHDSGDGNPRIRYEKRINGSIFYVEEKRDRRYRKMVAVTLFKKRATQEHRATDEDGLQLTSETNKGLPAEESVPGEGEKGKTGKGGEQPQIARMNTDESGKGKEGSGKREEKIEDFGEKIAGARKDYAAKREKAEGVDTAAVPLSKSWPEPDYRKFLKGARRRSIRRFRRCGEVRMRRVCGRGFFGRRCGPLVGLVGVSLRRGGRC